MSKRTRRQFSKLIIRKRNRMEVRCRRIAFEALKKQYLQVINSISLVPIDSLAEVSANLVTEEPVKKFMLECYGMTGAIAVDYRLYAIGQKSDELIWENTFEDTMRHYALTAAGSRISSITATSEKYIRGAVESAIEYARTEGLGVIQTRKLIEEYLYESLGSIGKSRAKMIAQTELISASNIASQEGIKSTGLEYRKFWSTSGLAGIRESHIQAQEDSIAVGGLQEDELFSNGLAFPGDPSGPAEEVINCRCICEYEML